MRLLCDTLWQRGDLLSLTWLQVGRFEILSGLDAVDCINIWRRKTAGLQTGSQLHAWQTGPENTV